jgi:hypothetical protein
MVMLKALSLAGPDPVPTALQGLSPPLDRSNDIDPPYVSAVATPLIAPFQSPLELIQAPSTHEPDCTTVRVMVIVEAFADSSVPVHVPARLANGPVGTVGPAPGRIGEEAVDPQAVIEQARTIA